MTINRHQSRWRGPGVDPEHRRGGGVNHPQPDAPAALDLHHLGIRKRAVVGKIGVPVIVVEVHRHAVHGPHPHHAAHGAVIHASHRHVSHRAMVHVCHAAHARALIASVPTRGPVAGRDLGHHLLGRLEREIVQEQHHLLPVSGDILGAAHDQRCRQEAHLVQRHMRVHPIGAGKRREVIGACLAGGEHRQRHVGHAILCVGGDLAVPVDQRVDIEIVTQIHPEPRAWVECQALSGRPGKTPDGGGATIDVQRPAGGVQRQRGGVLCCRDPGQMRIGQHGCASGKKAAS